MLALDPDRCDRCGRCVAACASGALKVGASYIYVSWRDCDECYACVEACDRAAITRRESGRGTASDSRSARSAIAVDTQSARRSNAKHRSKPGAGSVGQPPAEKNAGGLVAWTLTEAGVVLAVVLAALTFKDAALSSAWAEGLSADTALMARVVLLAVLYVSQGGVLWFLVHRRGSSLSSAFSLGRLRTSMGSKVVSALLVIVLLVGTRVAAWIYAVIAQALGYEPPVSAIPSLTQVFGADALGLGLSVFMVVLVGPVVEEIVFRGVLLDAFEHKFGAWVALFSQAALFALYHFTPWLFVPTFILGLATGWIARERDSLWPAIILHGLYNAIPVGIAFWLAV